MAYLNKQGLLHYFRVGDLNFLYLKYENKSFLVDNDTFLSLKFNSELNTSCGEELDNMFQVLESTPISVFLFKNIFVQKSGVSALNNEEHIYSIKYAQTDVFFSEKDVDIDYVSSFKKMQEANGVRNNVVFQLDGENIAAVTHCRSAEVHLWVNLKASSFTEEIIRILDEVKPVVCIEYKSVDENAIHNLIKKIDGSFIFKIENDEESISFQKFLKSLFKTYFDPYIQERIYYIRTLYNYIEADYVSVGSFYKTEGEKITRIENKYCSSCWAQNICWHMNLLEAFNISIENLQKDEIRCDLIRNLIEEGFSSLFQKQKIAQIQNNLTHENNQ